LPDLIRQSMRQSRSLRFAALFDSWRVSMDHRVKPGGDAERVVTLRMMRPRWRRDLIRPRVVKRSGGGGPPEGRWRGLAAVR
jgi:hypothetical protein